MKSLVFFLEEPSAEELLKGIVQRMLSYQNLDISYIVFEGKQDLEKHIERRIRLWNKPNSFFLIMRDQDSGDCIEIKNNLLDKIKQTSKLDKSLVRIACHELESFYLGDLLAVEKALEITNLSRRQNNQKYRDPDRLGNPYQELKRLTDNKYQKILGSKEIRKHIKLDGTNKSKSFNNLLKGIIKLSSHENTKFLLE